MAVEEELLGSVETYAFDPPGRRGVELGVEQASEVPRAKGSRRGQGGQAVVSGGVGDHRFGHCPEWIAARWWGCDRCGELGLTAGSLHEDDQLPGYLASDLCAMVRLDEGEGQVDAGADAGRGHVPVVVDV